MPFVITIDLMLLRNFVNKPVDYINMWLPSLNIFVENQFFEIMK